MSQLTINFDSAYNEMDEPGKGDSIRQALDKCQTNVTELYGKVGGSVSPDVVVITGSVDLTKAAHQGKVLLCTTGALSLTVNNSTDFDELCSCEVINKTGGS